MRTRSGPIGVNGDSENRIDNEIERRENQESIDTNVTSTKKTRKNTNDKKKIVTVNATIIPAMIFPKFILICHFLFL